MQDDNANTVDENDKNGKSTSAGKIVRTVAIIAVVACFVGLFIASLGSLNPSAADQVWNKEMTVGNLEAKNYYIMYTDLMCPYCDVFSREVMNHWDEFTQYLADNDILFEIRLTDALYEGVGSEHSRDAAEAAYCAKRENKFWDFYHSALAALWNDYHSKGIGVNKTAPKISNMADDYWLKIGHEAGLGESFDNCVQKHESVDEIEKNTARALQSTEGMPSFKFNNFITSGFSDTWDWSYVKRYLDAGLAQK